VSGKELANRQIRDAVSVNMLHLVTKTGQIVVWGAAFAFGFFSTFHTTKFAATFLLSCHKKPPERPVINNTYG
jgi:hypothetical protein